MITRTSFVFHSFYFVLSYKVAYGLSVKILVEYIKWLKISAKYAVLVKQEKSAKQYQMVQEYSHCSFQYFRRNVY
jgi:hypothetical protein